MIHRTSAPKMWPGSQTPFIPVDQARAPKIVPAWCKGRKPVDECEEYTVDCGNVKNTQLTLALRSEIQKKFRDTGLVLLTNTGFTDLDQMQRCVLQCGPRYHERKFLDENMIWGNHVPTDG